MQGNTLRYEYKVKSIENCFSDKWLEEYINDQAKNGWKLVFMFLTKKQRFPTNEFLVLTFQKRRSTIK